MRFEISIRYPSVKDWGNGLISQSVGVCFVVSLRIGEIAYLAKFPVLRIHTKLTGGDIWSTPPSIRLVGVRVRGPTFITHVAIRVIDIRRKVGHN